LALSLRTGDGGREDGGLKHKVPGSRKKLDNPLIPVTVIDGDWLTVGWTFSDAEAEVKSDFDETMTVLDKGWASVVVVLEIGSPLDEVTAFDKEDE